MGRAGEDLCEWLVVTYGALAHMQLHALERLSLRTKEKDDRAEKAAEGDEHDLEILMAEDGDEHVTRGDDGGCLGEMLVRLGLASLSKA